METTKISAGLAFMQTAASAMPKSLGDRVRSATMNELMHIALRSRMVFATKDVAALNRLSIRTSVGVFRPMDEHFYALSCLYGGTYPKMWEAGQKQKPWVAERVIPWASVRRNLPGGGPLLEHSRIARHIGVLLPLSFGRDEPDLARYDGQAVWWCSSMDDESIGLTRYRVTDDHRKRYYGSAPFVSEGHPARVRKVSRAEWQDLNQNMDTKLAA